MTTSATTDGQDRCEKSNKLTVNVVSAALVLVCGLIGVFGTLSMIPHEWGKSIVIDRIDTIVINDGLSKAHTLRDCWSWFHGPWVGENQFYRPLSSMAWWFLYKAWGENALAQFQIVQMVSHITLLFLLWPFLRALYGNAIAVASTCTFALFLTSKLGLPSGEFATVRWLDNVEMWVGACIILSGWLFLKYIRTDSRKYMGLSILMYICGIGCKEMAYIIPAFLAFLMWHERSFAKWKAVMPYLFIGAICFAYRTHIFHGRGAHYGSNGSWAPRAAIELGGGMAALQVSHAAFDSFGMLFMLLAVVFLASAVVHKSLKAGLGFIGSVAACALFISIVSRVNGYSAWLVPMTWFESGKSFFISRMLCDAFPVMILFAFWFRLLTHPNRAQLEGWIWGVIMYLPALTAPITGHVLYHSAIGWGVFCAAPIVAWLTRVAPNVVGWFDYKSVPKTQNAVTQAV